MIIIMDGSQECAERKDEDFKGSGPVKGSYDVNICTKPIGHRPPHMDKNSGRTW